MNKLPDHLPRRYIIKAIHLWDARCSPLCQIFILAIACCSDLLEAIDIPGSEIIAIMLANFRLFKPASEDILL